MAETAWLEELPLDECLALLRSSTVGRIAVVVDGSPVILPINFRLVETSGRTWVAVRTRPGNTINQAGLHAAFEIDAIDPVHHEGWSVLARGTLHPVDSDAAAFWARFDPEPWLLDDRDAWMIIEPFAITGRRLHSGAHEWAFRVDAYL